jgi:hypothetical protein
VTTEVAARALRVSPRTIRRYIERDDLRRSPEERPSWWGIVLVCGVAAVAAALLLIYLVLLL